MGQQIDLCDLQGSICALAMGIVIQARSLRGLADPHCILLRTTARTVRATAAAVGPGAVRGAWERMALGKGGC